MNMNDPIQAEFARQAAQMDRAPVFQAETVLDWFVKAIHSSSPARVLDLACGPGIVAEVVAPHVKEVVGVDATSAMIRHAQLRFEKARLTNGRFEMARAESLPFAGDEFDTVITRLSFHHFSNLPAVLTETRRVLKPRGYLAVADILSSDDPGESALHNALEKLRDPTHVHMLSRADFTDSIRFAGFELLSENIWEQERTFSDWAQIVSDPTRTDPIREVMQALARSGQQAGIALREEAGEIRFIHTWFMGLARAL